MSWQPSQSSIFAKREYQAMIVPPVENKDITQVSVDELKSIREERCGQPHGGFVLQPHQEFVRTFMRTDSYIRGMLMFWKTGVGKTCGAVQVADNFCKMARKYKVKIMILAPAKLTQNFVDTLTGPCLRATVRDVNETKRSILDNYYIISHKGYVLKVLGERILKNGKPVRNVHGEIQYRMTGPPIRFLKNTLLIIDEAHSMTGDGTSNRRAIEKVINHRKTKNLKILLLTATPMNNTAGEIIPLLNFMKAPGHKIKFNDIFLDNPLRFKPGGKKKLKNAARGIVSFVRGGDPYTYAQQVDQGKVIYPLKFTPVVACPMSSFQEEAYIRYREELKVNNQKSFNHLLRDCSLMVFPDISVDGNHIIATTGKNVMMRLGRKLKRTNILKLCRKKFKNLKIGTDFIKGSEQFSNVLSGSFLHEHNLQTFSSKYWRCLQEINKNVRGTGMKGPGKIFVSCLLVWMQARLFEQVLLANGYLPYSTKQTVVPNYSRCSECGVQKKDHDTKNHPHTPACYVVITGTQEEDEDTNKIINIFNHPDNRYGKKIKIIIGTQVLQEGISLKNMSEVHILQGHWHLTAEEQIIGRAIRHCSHMDVMRDGIMYPKVRIYRYVTVFKHASKKILTIGQTIYKKAEQKLKLIKEVEQVLVDCAVDCPILYNQNRNLIDIQKQKDCGKPGHPSCLPRNNFTDGDIHCHDQMLKVWFRNGTYNPPAIEDIDETTYNPRKQMGHEIKTCLKHLQDFFRVEIRATLEDLIYYVRNHYPAHKQKHFDKHYLFEAINLCRPRTDNEKNRYGVELRDQYNQPCYLIKRNRYYIRQPSHLSETASIQQRIGAIPNLDRFQTLNNIMSKDGYNNTRKSREQYMYDQTYYEHRSVSKIYGIWAQNPKTLVPVFKLCDVTRSGKSRGENCSTFSIDDLDQYIDMLHIKRPANRLKNKNQRCKLILDDLLIRERTSTKPHLYFKVPVNAKDTRFVFPLKITDRRNYIESYLQRYKKRIKYFFDKDGKNVYLQPAGLFTEIKPEIVTWLSGNVLSDKEMKRLGSKGSPNMVKIELYRDIIEYLDKNAEHLTYRFIISNDGQRQIILTAKNKDIDRHIIKWLGAKPVSKKGDYFILLHK